MVKGIFWRENGSREVFSDFAINGYNTDNYTEEELEDIISAWYKEDEEDDDDCREYWIDDWRKHAIGTKIDNAIIHYSPISPFIAKAKLNLYCKDKLVYSLVLRDDDVCRDWLARQGLQSLNTKTIVHC